MEILTKTILAAGLAIASTSTFACADSQYTGNFTDGTKTISLYERERCGAIHVPAHPSSNSSASIIHQTATDSTSNAATERNTSSPCQKAHTTMIRAMQNASI